MTSLCLWSFKWSHLIINTEKYQHLLDTHPATDDGFIHVVWWIVKNSEWKIYLHHHAKLNEFMIPWGKVEQGENFDQALCRELKEELDIDVLSLHQISSIKYIVSGKRRCFHIFMIDEYQWIPINNESDKFDQYRAEIIDSDNDLGFAVNVDGTIIHDVQDIMQSFLELYHIVTIIPQISDDILLLSSYREYDQTKIDLSQHYYLYLDLEKKLYYFQDL